MKILILNQYNMPPELGHLNRHYYLAEALTKLGNQVTVLVGSKLHNTNKQMINDKVKYKKYENSDFDYYFIKTCDYANSKIKRVYAMFQYIFNLNSLVKKLGKFDVVIGSSAHPLTAYKAIKIAKKQKAISIAEIRDLWPESIVAYNILSKKNPIVSIMYFFERWLYSKANRLIFTMEGGSKYIEEKGWNLSKRLKVDTNKIYHVNNGINLSEFHKNKKLYEFNDCILDDSNIFKVIYIGAIRKVNKLDILLDAAKMIKNKNVKFFIFGLGDLVDHITERIKTENILNVFYKGSVEKRFIPSILSKSNLNIITGESLPLFNYGISMNKLFDYFASGKPVLCTFKAKYSIIEKYNAGIEIETLNFENISNEIENLYYDNDRYQLYSKGASLAALDYDYNILAKKIMKCIDGKQ